MRCSPTPTGGSSPRPPPAPSTTAPVWTIAPVVPRPGKIICVGVNYAAHIAEMGRDTPTYPTLFAKYPEALVGAFDDVVLPAASQAMDWEAELAVVIGAPVRHADEAAAEAAIAGYAVLNDVTARDWQYRTLQWLQGKTFEATTPFGPELVTAGRGRGDRAGPELRRGRRDRADREHRRPRLRTRRRPSPTSPRS